MTGMSDDDMWEQYLACFQNCTKLQEQLTNAGVRLGPDCYASENFLNAPIRIKLMLQQQCLESLQAMQRSWQARQSSEQGQVTFLNTTIHNSNNNISIGSTGRGSHYISIGGTGSGSHNGSAPAAAAQDLSRGFSQPVYAYNNVRARPEPQSAQAAD